MMKSLLNVFFLYLSIGLRRALKVILRILILPFWKIDEILPRSGVIIDLGCGEGGLANYLAFRSQDRKILGIDLTRERIQLAKKTVMEGSRVKFIRGDALKVSLQSADCYLLVDVLHHIIFSKQEGLLKELSQKMDKNSLLVIKEVDDSKFLQFWFGHIIEKILYQKEVISTRSTKEWLKLFNLLGLSCRIGSGNLLFPDSTILFVCKKK